MGDLDELVASGSDDDCFRRSRPPFPMCCTDCLPFKADGTLITVLIIFDALEILSSSFLSSKFCRSPPMAGYKRCKTADGNNDDTSAEECVACLNTVRCRRSTTHANETNTNDVKQNIKIEYQRKYSRIAGQIFASQVGGWVYVNRIGAKIIG